MLIFLYGPDSYRRLRKKQWYVASFAKKHPSSGIGYFDISLPGEHDNLVSFLSHRSLFDSVKFAVVEHALLLSVKNLKALLSSHHEDDRTHILFSEENAPPKSIAGFFAAPGAIIKHETLKGVTWRQFVREEAREKRVGFTQGAFEFLASAYEGDSWRLATELEKISGLRKKNVETDDFGKLDIELPPDFWRLVQGLRTHNVASRLFSLELLFAAQEPAAKTFNILSSLWSGKMSHFAAYDKAIKIGKFEYEEALIALVIG